MTEPQTAAAAEPIGPGILARVAAGERLAMEACLRRYGALVWSAARRFLGADAEAEDAVQEIFIELWRHAGRHDPRLGTEATFVMTLARRRLIDRRRRSARRPVLTALDELAEPAAPEVAPLAPDADAEHALAVVGALPAEQRRLLLLSVCDGLTHQEIATRLGLPLGTVKTALRRGLQRVRAALGVSARPA